MWPFKRREPEKLSPTELRDRLIRAATGSQRRLRALCRQYKHQVAENLDEMRKIPEELRSNPPAANHYVQCLGAVAHCLATQCDAPELWNTLCGTPDDNPVLQWERWYGQLPERMERLEYGELISEAKKFIEQVKTFQGNAAREHEAYFQGHLGTLLFHSGKASEAEEPYRSALALCRETGDVEGQCTYLNNLLEVYCYLGEHSSAIATGERLIQLSQQQGKDAASLVNRLERIRGGESLCRIVCVRGGNEWEIDELTTIMDGRYEFQFRRNRLSLQKSLTLVRQGNELASSGQLADALEMYQEAAEVDPYDPDPAYQSGMCLLEMGAYSKAREAFEEVERLAPGWFRCRSDIWLARSLDEGNVSEEEFRLLRVLDDGGLNRSEALRLARQAVEKHPKLSL